MSRLAKPLLFIGFIPSCFPFNMFFFIGFIRSCFPFNMLRKESGKPTSILVVLMYGSCPEEFSSKRSSNFRQMA